MPAGASDRPLFVRLLKEPQPASVARSRRVLMAILIIAVIVFWGLEGLYHLPESTPLLSFENAPINVNARLYYPEFASVGDTGYVEMTAINAGDELIAGTLVIVLDSTADISLLPDNRASLTFANLPPGDQTSHRLEFRVVGPWDPLVVDSLSFHLLLLPSGGSTYPSAQREIALMPIPYLGRILAWVRTVFQASLAALFLERIKKWLFP